MIYYKGYSLIEYVTVHPPCRAGQHGISVHDELIGVVINQPTMEEAQKWIDQQIQIADMMLAKTFNRSI